MSEYTPSQDDMRSAWRFAMTGDTTPDEAADTAFDRYTDAFKRRQQGVGYMAAQEAMQSTIDGSIQEVQERAWGEGMKAVMLSLKQPPNEQGVHPIPPNPYAHTKQENQT